MKDTDHDGITAGAPATARANGRTGETASRGDPGGSPPSTELAGPVIQRTSAGWSVGDAEVGDLTSAMVLADLLAGDLPRPARPPAEDAAQPENDRLRATVAQLEHALATRVRIEQAIGVLAERHRLAPRAAFELLRGAARTRGLRLPELAADVVASAANALLRVPDELQRPPAQFRPRGRRRGVLPSAE